MSLLKEATTADVVGQAKSRDGKIIREITLIQEGWGSSGYYSAEVLERDGPRAFPPGTHMYINHPTEAERQARPERDVRDLAAVLVSTPRMRGIELVAEAEIKQHWAPVIDALAEDIGTSIVANGLAEHGKAGGKEGPIIKALTEGLSVDFVTKAGAGGKIGPLIESAHAKSVELREARNSANWLESRIHQDFTVRADELFGDGRLTREERIALSTAIGEALTAFNTSVEANAPGLLDRDPFAEAPTGELSVEETTELDESSRTKESDMDQEKELSELKESVRRLEESDRDKDRKIQELEESTQKEKDRADRAEEVIRSQEAARLVGEALGNVEGLPKSAVTRVAEAVLRGDLPTTEDGKLDSEKLKESTVEAAKQEAKYIAGLTGQPVDASESIIVSGGEGSGKTGTDNEAALVEAFRSRGMSEEAAKIAAKGR